MIRNKTKVVHSKNPATFVIVFFYPSNYHEDMTSPDLQQISDIVERIVNRAIEPLIKNSGEHTAILNQHTAKLDHLTTITDEHSETLLRIEGDIQEMKEETNKRLDKIENHIWK